MAVGVHVISGYAGSEPKIKVIVGGHDHEKNGTYLMEMEEVKSFLERAILENGFTKSLKPRQQYERLTINEKATA